MKPLVIVGAGGLGREVAWLVEDINRNDPQWDFLGFVDDNIQGTTAEGYPILGLISSINDIKSCPWVAIAIADPFTRKRLYSKIKEFDLPIATLIHPSSFISRYNNVGEGSIICAASVITTRVTLGKACIVNPGCFIGHDTVLEDWTSLMPAVSIAGEVRVGSGCFWGIKSCAINRTSIGKWSVIGAGATVIENIPAYSVAVGVPARVVKKVDRDFLD